MNCKLKTIAEMQTTKDKLVARAQSNCNILNELYANLPAQHELQVELEEFDKILDDEAYDGEVLCDMIDRTSDMLDDGRAYIEEYDEDIETVNSRPNLNDREY